MSVRAPAKINLQLSVGPLGEDGFHPLVSVFHAVSLWETVIATPRDDAEFTCSVEARASLVIAPGSVPTDSRNLAVRAAALLAERHGVRGGVDLRIIKGVPVAGGMAGGSADAAAALVACSEAWGLGLGRTELTALAAELGSDVPFSLHGHTAVGMGRGDVLSPAMTRGELHWVIATQEAGLSTAEVYRGFDRGVEDGTWTAREPRVDQALMYALRSGDPVRVGEHLSNDLEHVALDLRPELTGVIEAARSEDAAGVIVSGSGPTIVALARSAQHALAMASHIRACHVASVVFVATGPVTGATIIGSGGV